MANGQTIRVYVCSAYRDMQAERRFLHEVIFPGLQSQFEQHGYELEVIDPRRTAATEEEAEGVATLETGLEAIDQCRPHFLGIFGANYGRVLDEIPAAVGQKYPGIRHFVRSSRIHLETLHGVLRDPRQATHSFFYFRRPDFLEQVPAADRALYLPSNPVPAINDIEAHKLEMLKGALRAAHRPILDYHCRWDAQNRCVTALERFGERVSTDLLSIIGVGRIPAAAAAAAAEAVSLEPPRAAATGTVVTRMTPLAAFAAPPGEIDLATGAPTPAAPVATPAAAGDDIFGDDPAIAAMLEEATKDAGEAVPPAEATISMGEDEAAAAMIGEDAVMAGGDEAGTEHEMPAVAEPGAAAGSAALEESGLGDDSTAVEEFGAGDEPAVEDSSLEEEPAEEEEEAAADDDEDDKKAKKGKKGKKGGKSKMMLLLILLILLLAGAGAAFFLLGE